MKFLIFLLILLLNSITWANMDDPNCWQVSGDSSIYICNQDAMFGGQLMKSSCDCPKIRKDTRWVKIDNGTLLTVGCGYECPENAPDCIIPAVYCPPTYADNNTWQKETCLTKDGHRWACEYSEPQRGKDD